MVFLRDEIHKTACGSVVGPQDDPDRSGLWCGCSVKLKLLNDQFLNSFLTIDFEDCDVNSSFYCDEIYRS